MGLTIQDLLSGDIVKPRPQQEQNSNAGLGTMLSFLSQGGQNQIASVPKQDNFMDSAFMQNTMKDSADRRASEQLAIASKGSLDEMISLETNPHRVAMLKQQQAFLNSGNPILQKLGVQNIGSIISGIMPSYTPTTVQKNINDPEALKYLLNKQKSGKTPVGTTMNDKGELVNMPMAGGGTYYDQQMAKQLSLQNNTSPLETLNYNLSVRNADRQDEAAIRAEKTVDLAEKRYQESLRKDIPPAHRAAFNDNKSMIDNIDKAIKQVTDNPDAFGLMNILPEQGTQYLDPEGVTPRAAVAGIGAIKRHDMSGATITAAEQPYLAPFIPSTADRSDAILKKLNQMKETINSEQGNIQNMYSDPAFRNQPWVKKSDLPTESGKTISDNPDDYPDYQSYTNRKKQP
jgi:hypothetical protein